MNRLKWKVSLPAALLMLVGMTACSDEDMPGGNEGTPVSQSTVTVGNDPTAQADRIFFFGNPGTRAGNAVEFAEVGSEPKDLDYTKMTKLNSEGVDISKLSDNTKYYLGEDFTAPDKEFNIPANSVLYIDKTLTITRDCALFKGNGKIYIVGDGKLVVSNKLQFGENNDKIELRAFENSNIEIPGELLVNGKFLSKGVVTVKGTCNVGGVLIAKDLNLEGKFQVYGEGKAKATCITSTYEDNNQSIVINGILVVRNHLACKSLYVDGTVCMRPYSIVDVDGTTGVSSASAFKYESYEGKDGLPCMVRTKGLVPNISYVDLKAMFRESNLKIKYDTKNMSDQLMNLLNVKNNDPSDDLPFESWDDYYVPKPSEASCHEGNGTAPQGDSDYAKVFDEIAVVKAPEGTTHGHDYLSATCVQPLVSNNAGKVYISYHLNTEYDDPEEDGNVIEQAAKSQYMGCAELFNLDATGATISSWLRNEDFDFNHMIVDGSKLYTVGDTKKYGATLGVVNLKADGSFGNYEMTTDDRAEQMAYYNLYKKVEANRGSSGNCLIKNGDNLLFASYLGFQKGAFNDKNELVMDNEAFLSTTGSAKHIATDGQYIVTLNLNAKDVKSSSATVKVYNVDGFAGFGSPVKTFITKSEVSPIDGKNVVAVKDGFIYVCLGETGVEKWSVEGAFVKSYNYNDKVDVNDHNDKAHPRANGLDVDANYVYVANGEGGLIVLDKETMEPVGNYVADWSANYVRAIGDYVYIAYGRSGLIIVKMKDNEAVGVTPKIEEQ